jgi:hypothetical protein
VGLHLNEVASLLGSHDAQESEPDLPLELILNENHTFTFNSSFDLDNKIKEKGTREINKGNLFLKSENKDLPTK